MTGQRTRRLRRCQLSTPASSDKMLVKAAASDADFVFLDLEDAVAPKAKPAARGNAVRALRELDWGRKTCCLRVNALDTPYWLDDVIEVVTGARERLDVIMVPKVMRASDVRVFDAVLTQLERKLGLEKRIGLDLLIEEVQALQNVEAIATSTPRVEALIFGMGDYSASQGIDILRQMQDPLYPGDIYHYARFRLVMAARAAGLDAVDGPWVTFHDTEGFRTECLRVRSLGMAGKWAIHPSQIAIANAVFTPDPEAVAKARRIAAAYAEAEARGEGAVAIDGMMQDAATVRLLGNTLALADLLGM
ncbi:MAG: CoA ester lyase [Nevskiaceae bacterium]|nr:MAG: CoA ester lyase [Nevskiaceae bacterium]TBR74615.1 MAG: CoA ester lyase [Nevskiaceae bacterium]